MQYGLSSNSIQKICGVFAAFPAVEKAVLYGSRAKGNYKPGSDIDLTLYGEQLTLKLLGDITEALDDVLLPYSIDLSLFDELEHSKLREHIERVGVVFYARAVKGGAVKRGWEVKKLGDVCEIYQPQTISTKDMVPDGEFPVFGANGIIGKYDQYNHEEPQLLVTCRGATCGSVNISLPKSWITGNAMVIRPKVDGLSVKYVEYFFRGACDFSKVITGAAQPQITRQSLAPVTIAFPPLREQHQIVAVLDEAFAGIATATANAKKNLQTARELFESHLQSIFTTKGDGWVEKTLGDIAEVEYGYTDKSTGEGDYRYVRITDIDTSGELILEDKKYIKHSKEAEGFLLADNDLLMARTGATFAKVLLYKDHEPSVFASYLIRIKFKENIENKLYWYFTKTVNYWAQANSLSSGAAQPHFNGAALKQVAFRYPESVKEQRLLIEQLDTLSTETKRLEAIYQQKLDNLAALKQSILQKAFAGELQLDRLAA